MKKNNNNIVLMIVVLIVGGLIGFFGGMQYQKSHAQTTFAGQGANAQGAGRQGFMRGQFGARNGGNQPISGDILNIDGSSVVVKLADGSTKIVVLSDSTQINKSSQASKTDLKSGDHITAFGTTNSDGSVTAQMVSLGNMMYRGFGGRQNASPSGTPTTTNK